ncbi:hypothetical protein DUZ99_15210 [Xylanibacillus composti]|uniref:Uncharacterized protein n=1 Tax=Xylanibacillus composti TaxID=1572762 RepID=A0A8J4H3Y3_9BACL|nr:DUF6220 domain-containing protein [Xylanibacillus composti]MDT9726330.1 hypothetical protein [Xylanibacillus composti]GIQ70562.1 hypothetical protein XYCOK13_33860 [Xylanibacillus composti]
MSKERSITKLNQVSRALYFSLACGLIACILIQTYLAGMALFMDPGHWRTHTLFVHMFEVIPLLMLIFSFTGRLPISMRMESTGLLLLIFVQYFTANVAVAGAAHPVIALVLFVLSVQTTLRAWKQLRVKQEASVYGKSAAQ